MQLLDEREAAWSDRMLTVERFERRLSEDLAGLRVALIREMNDVRFDLLKWSFLFWIGQVAVMVGLLTFMLRGPGR
jgi:hypothetical protein